MRLSVGLVGVPGEGFRFSRRHPSGLSGQIPIELFHQLCPGAPAGAVAFDRSGVSETCGFH